MVDFGIALLCTVMELAEGEYDINGASKSYIDIGANLLTHQEVEWSPVSRISKLYLFQKKTQ